MQDYVGGRNGIHQNSGSTWSDDIDGACLDFNGSTGKVWLEKNYPQLRGMEQLTVVTRVLVRTQRPFDRCVDLSRRATNATDQVYRMGVFSTGDWWWRIWNLGGTASDDITGKAVVIGDWTNIAGRYDGDEVSMFIDGKKQSDLQTGFAGPLRNPTVANTTLSIGYGHLTSDIDALDCKMGMLLIYDRALEDKDLQDLHQDPYLLFRQPSMPAFFVPAAPAGIIQIPSMSLLGVGA